MSWLLKIIYKTFPIEVLKMYFSQIIVSNLFICLFTLYETTVFKNLKKLIFTFYSMINCSVFNIFSLFFVFQNNSSTELLLLPSQYIFRPSCIHTESSFQNRDSGVTLAFVQVSPLFLMAARAYKILTLLTPYLLICERR